MKRLLSLVAGGLLLATSTAAVPARPGTSYSGDLYRGESGSLDLVLHAGTTYTYRGSCDLDCNDLDFALYEWVPPYNGRRGYWRFMVADRASNDTPLVWVRPTYDATFRLSIIMSRCDVEPCGYDVDLSW